MVPSAEENFHIHLNALAKMTRFELDQVILKIYDEHLKKYGYEKLTIALKELIVERTSRDPFPSVRAIERKVVPITSDKSKANFVANQILKYVRTKGHTWSWVEPGVNFVTDVLFKTLGDIGGATVVQLGGWTAVCEMANNGNTEFFRHNLEKAAMNIIEFELKNSKSSGRPITDDRNFPKSLE